MRIDFGRTARDYAGHRAGFPESFYARLRERGLLPARGALLDLGTGTGNLARGFAARGERVIGIDPSAPLVAAARRLDRDRALPTRYALAVAERLPFATSVFTAVSVGQCWHWFDRARAAREARRVLAPGGWLLIAQLDWLPLPGSVVEATERLILEHNPGWTLGGGNGLYPHWRPDLGGAGFAEIDAFTDDLEIPYSHEGWRGRIRASAGVAASLPPPAVRAFDAELRSLLAARFRHEPLAVPHRVYALHGRLPR